MSRYPLLEQLRGERERFEAELTEPIRAQADRWRAEASSLRGALSSIEHALGSDMAKHVVAEIAHAVASELRRAITMAVAKADPGQSLITLVLPADVIRFSDSRSWERAVLDRCVSESFPRMSLAAGRDASEGATMLKVTLPSVSSMCLIADYDDRR